MADNTNQTLGSMDQTSDHTIQEELFNDKELYKTLLKVKNGNFKARFPVDEVGLAGKFCDTLNEIIELNQQLELQISETGKLIGKQGKLDNRIELSQAKGSWKKSEDALNTLINDLIYPTTQMAHVIRSVSKGNLTEEMPLTINGIRLKGEFLRIAKDVNRMVQQLNMFSMEVTRVAREVGTEGKLVDRPKWLVLQGSGRT